MVSNLVIKSPASTTVTLHYRFCRKQLIPLESNHIWQIKTGLVRSLTWDEEGNWVTLGIWGLGDVVGKPLSKIPLLQVECLTPVEAVFIQPSKEDLFDIVLHQFQQVEQLLSITQSGSVAYRLQRFLVWFSDRFGHLTTEGRAIEFGLTHQEIAETIRSSRVTVTKLLNQFEREGLICRNEKGFLLKQNVKISL